MFGNGGGGVNIYHITETMYTYGDRNLTLELREISTIPMVIETSHLN